MRRSFLAAFAVLPVALAALVTVAQGQHSPSRVSASLAKLTICVKTAAGTSFRRITVSSRAVTSPSSAAGKTLRAHLLRTGDAIVVGTGACPSASATPSHTSTPPAKITICHKTASTTNPFRRITVSSRAVTNPNSASGKVLRGQLRQTGNLILPGASGCPAGKAKPTGIKLTADLRPVSPATTGSGSATATIRLGQGQLCFTLTVSGLTNVTAAHIHRASTGDVVVPLTAPTSGSSSGCVNVQKTLLQEIVNNPSGFYVNVHTMSFPNGQIRGTLAK